MGTVKVFDKEVKLEVSVFLFKDGEVFNAYCPELDLVGCDYTAEGAKESFGVVLSDYLKYTLEKGTLERDLLKHGWNKTKEDNVFSCFLWFFLVF